MLLRSQKCIIETTLQKEIILLLDRKSENIVFSSLLTSAPLTNVMHYVSFIKICCVLLCLRVVSTVFSWHISVNKHLFQNCQNTVPPQTTSSLCVFGIDIFIYTCASCIFKIFYTNCMVFWLQNKLAIMYHIILW